MPLILNPYFNAFAMPSMPCQMPMMNAAYMNHISMNNSEFVTDEKPKVDGQSSKVKKESIPVKPKDEVAPKPKVKTNKVGPKTAWVPKSNYVGF